MTPRLCPLVLLAVLAPVGCRIAPTVAPRYAECVLPPGVPDPTPGKSDVTFILLSGETISRSCAPFRLATVSPVTYPEPARKARLQGSVIVIGRLSDLGCVEEAFVAHGINPLLDNAALRSVAAWAFEPIQPGAPITPWFRATVTFRLR